MRLNELRKYKAETAAYCKNLTDAQLRNVFRDETERGKGQGEVAEVARIFAGEASLEMARRGLE